ncbi:Na+/H+-dicarboxylate symporter [Sarcina sp. DSM 11001]|uniref:dicarboxylate/amino acid:cation symporter n=1 Tax=Sarcina sp. DSM 11001 TaxID=1798184 RepID=UPI000886E393|nr:dicarboxylate/amino acid:cation symporter [Sarcina sp. DSM 11001]SDK29359.1 Na+/H+-dicarboxylate symporter [Sarcina sp. DSM 11001]
MKRVKITDKRQSFATDSRSFMEDSIEFIHTSLSELGIAEKLVTKTELLAEEMIVQMIQHATTTDAVLYIRIRRFLGDTSVNFHMQGDEFNPFADAVETVRLTEKDDKDMEEAIRSIVMRSFGENFKYRHINNANWVRILSGQADQSMLVLTLTALVLGLIFGALAKLVFPEVLTTGLCTYLLTPVKTIFMNALKVIIAPVVFFSIVTCISQFNSILELGRLGAKVMGMYLLTTVIAVFLGISITLLVQPGEWAFALSGSVPTAAVTVDTSVDTSILNTIVNIVPSNFIAPFVQSDTLQIIFLAIVCGVAVGMIGKYSKTLKDLFEACNSLFLTITTMIARFIPAAVFCSVSLLVIELGGSSLLSVLGAGLTHVLITLCMLCVYGILVLVMARLNPLTFFRKNREGMLTSFTLCSSSASMPTNLRTCTDKLGISPKVCNFSIPLGATVNMDGTCIYLCVMGLFLARAYGVSVSPSSLFSIAVTIILLSLGAPGVPGAALVCMSVVLTALNVPVEAIGLIIAIDPLLDMFITMSNTTGDVMAALVVAKAEKLLDLEKYQSP